ncbi:MAG: hypothetical protein ABH807_02955 [Candidatus Shapirobacteria bacterium]
MTAFYHLILAGLGEKELVDQSVLLFAQNILTERLARQLKNVSLPYQQINYLPLGELPVFDPERFLSQLNDNEQVILRQIFHRRFTVRSELEADSVTSRSLMNFFYRESGNGGELEETAGRFFFEGEEITAHLSISQQKLLAGLLVAPGRLVKKDQGIIFEKKAADHAPINKADQKTLFFTPLCQSGLCLLVGLLSESIGRALWFEIY